MLKNEINLNLYKTFYDVCRYGSFSKAAEFTYTTQPSISKSIKKLEDELDTLLFYRKSDGVELTDKGKELLFYVEKSFGNLLTAERVLLERDELSRGKVKIGMPSHLYSYYMVDKIIAFKNKYPKIDISVITGTTSFLINELESHKIDFIIDTSPINILEKDVEIKDLFNLNYIFASKEKTLFHSIKDFENESIILPIDGTNNRKDLDELLFKNGIEFKNITELHTSEMILDSVKKGLGIGYILEDLASSLYKVDIKEELPKTKVVLIYNKRFLTNAPKTFINDYIIKL